MDEKRNRARHYRFLSTVALVRLTALKRRIEKQFPNLEAVLRDEWENYGERRLWQTLVIQKKGSVLAAERFQPLNPHEWEALDEGKFGRQEEEQFFMEHWRHLEMMNGS